MQPMRTNFREKMWRFDGGTAPRGTKAVQRTALWPKIGTVHPALGTKIISCPEVACGQSRCGQNAPPCGHGEPSSLPTHPGLTPLAGQNGPAVKQTASFSSPFFLPLPTARRCHSSHIFPPLPTACRRKGPPIVVPLPTAWRLQEPMQISASSRRLL